MVACSKENGGMSECKLIFRKDIIFFIEFQHMNQDDNEKVYLCRIEFDIKKVYTCMQTEENYACRFLGKTQLKKKKI